MRTVLVALCALLMMTISLEAKKVKIKTPAAQKTVMAKQHKAEMKHLQKTRKGSKRHQSVN